MKHCQTYHGRAKKKKKKKKNRKAKGLAQSLSRCQGKIFGQAPCPIVNELGNISWLAS